MAHYRQRGRVLIAVAAIGVAMLIPVSVASAQGVGVRQHGQGQYARLTAQWWQWILSQPMTGNPNLDPTGADAANGQPRDDIFFLAGSFGETVTRTFTVPAGTALFLPLLNNVGVAYPAMPNPQPKTNENQVPQLRTLYAAPTVDSVDRRSGLKATLDGLSLGDSVTRIKSPTFHFTSPAEDSFFGPGTFTAVSDGYWLYLAPLAPGTYVLNFGGTAYAGTPYQFTVDITDTITVQ